jgi:hypothetical protein
MKNLARTFADLDAKKTAFVVADFESLPAKGLPQVRDPVWRALWALLLRLWFFRLWTLQEIVLARDLVVLCGSESNPWDDLPLLTGSATNVSLSTLFMHASDAGMWGKEATTFIYQIQAIRTGLRTIKSLMNLPILLHFSIYRSYTEPIDRYWAILGLVSEHTRNLSQKANLIGYSAAARTNYHKTYLSVLTAQIDYEIYGGM